MRGGVTLLQPETVFLHDGVSVGGYSDWGGVSLLGHTTIGSGAYLENNSRISDSEIGAGTRIKAACYLENAVVADQCQVGPFARLREGTVLDTSVKVGNFVETKAHLEAGAGEPPEHIGDAGQ